MPAGWEAAARAAQPARGSIVHVSGGCGGVFCAACGTGAWGGCRQRDRPSCFRSTRQALCCRWVFKWLPCLPNTWLDFVRDAGVPPLVEDTAAGTFAGTLARLWQLKREDHNQEALGRVAVDTCWALFPIHACARRSGSAVPPCRACGVDMGGGRGSSSTLLGGVLWTGHCAGILFGWP